jgi:heme exporter protein D
MTDEAGLLTGYLAMGGHAAFVWPSYGVAALVLIGFALSSWRRLRRAERALDRLSEADPNLGDDA